MFIIPNERVFKTKLEMKNIITSYFLLNRRLNYEYCFR